MAYTDPHPDEGVLAATPDTRDFVFNQTMLRIKDPERSLKFYRDVLGMTLIKKFDFEEMRFSLYFLGYVRPEDRPIPSSAHDRAAYAFSKKAHLELTHNWGSEADDTDYHDGNSDPRGFGHIGLSVPNVEAACARFDSLGVSFVKRPDEGKMKGLAFIRDPDGYWIEILEASSLAAMTTGTSPDEQTRGRNERGDERMGIFSRHREGATAAATEAAQTERTPAMGPVHFDPVEGRAVELNTIPWVPFPDALSAGGIRWKLLNVAPEMGAWTAIFDCPAGSSFASHVHIGPGEYYLTRGRMEVRGGSDHGGETVTAPAYGYEACQAFHGKTYFPVDSEFYMTFLGPLNFVNEEGGSTVALVTWQVVQEAWQASVREMA